MDFNEVQNPQIRKALEDYNSNGQVIGEYTNKIMDMFKNNNENLSLLDMFRILGYSIVRLSSSYYPNQDALTNDMVETRKLIKRYYKEIILEGQEGVKEEDFAVKRLMTFAGNFVDTTMWKFFLQQSLIDQAEEEKKTLEEK